MVVVVLCTTSGTFSPVDDSEGVSGEPQAKGSGVPLGVGGPSRTGSPNPGSSKLVARDEESIRQRLVANEKVGGELRTLLMDCAQENDVCLSLQVSAALDYIEMQQQFLMDRLFALEIRNQKNDEYINTSKSKLSEVNQISNTKLVNLAEQNKNPTFVKKNTTSAKVFNFFG